MPRRQTTSSRMIVRAPACSGVPGPRVAPDSFAVEALIANVVGDGALIAPVGANLPEAGDKSEAKLLEGRVGELAA
jgi:hypothetical protein